MDKISWAAVSMREYCAALLVQNLMMPLTSYNRVRMDLDVCTEVNEGVAVEIIRKQNFFIEIAKIFDKRLQTERTCEWAWCSSCALYQRYLEISPVYALDHVLYNILYIVA